MPPTSKPCLLPANRTLCVTGFRQAKSGQRALPLPWYQAPVPARSHDYTAVHIDYLLCMQYSQELVQGVDVNCRNVSSVSTILRNIRSCTSTFRFGRGVYSSSASNMYGGLVHIFQDCAWQLTLLHM